MTGRIVTDGNGWMRDQERRMLRQERRPAPPSFADHLGPGVTQRARAIVDWNDPAYLRNGWYFSDTLSLNTPNPLLAWLGHTVVASDGRGVQQVWSHGAPPTALYTREFYYEGGSVIPTFTAWNTQTDPTIPTGLPVTRHYGTLNPQVASLPNTGTFTTAYHLTPGVAIPATARTAQVSMSTTAHSTVNAALVWQAYVRFPGWGDVQFADTYQHNDAVPTRDLSFSAVSTFDVRSFIGSTLEVVIIGGPDIAGGAVSPGRCSWNITFLG